MHEWLIEGFRAYMDAWMHERMQGWVGLDREGLGNVG